jgi:predicted transposase/invertase (TIGR01784 family)
MLDYRLRVYRRFPAKTMHQVVIYLKTTKSPLVYQDSFQLGETIHRYRVIRLWEQSSEVFLNKGGLLPLAILTKSEEQIIRLREVAKRLDTIKNPGVRANLMAATAVFAGLVMEPEMIKTILRSDIMKESAFYQEILQEGRQEGRQKGLQEGRQEGRQEGEVALLMRLLVKRFGNVSESIESRLIQASIADLELWGDRILDAKTLTDIFD